MEMPPISTETDPSGPPAPETPAAVTLAFYRAQTERLAVLLGFLTSPTVAPRDEEGNYDPDVVSAYNLAVEAGLKHVRQLVLAESPRAS
jgi:hypothetical protein